MRKSSGISALFRLTDIGVCRAAAETLDLPENALVRKLRTVADLNAEERSRLNHLCKDVRRIPRRRDIAAEGERPEHVHLIISGWAARYKVLSDGARQIVDFLIPGDFCDLQATVLDEMDHSITALTPCRVAYIEAGEIDRLASENRRLARLLWWSTLVNESILREWILNVGRRDAYGKVAHLLCEMHARMKIIGQVEGDKLALPLTQDEIADATGLTSVHVNRTLQRLRNDNLIEMGQGMLQLPDVAALQRVADFNPNYLHIKRRIQ